MSELERITEFQFDVLREIGNIGAGNAATALSTMLGSQIDMNVPRVHVCSFDDICDVIGGNEQIVAGIFLRMEGDLSGSIFFLLSISSAKKLLSSFMEDNAEPDEFNEMQLSALSEMGNILAGSYLTSLADFMKKDIQPSVPALAIDMAGALLSTALASIGQSYDVALVIDTEFIQDNWEIDGHFFLLPDPGMVDYLFECLGVNLI